MSLLQVRDIDVYYETLNIISDLTLTVDKGKSVVILGRNGAGKSTLLKAIIGLLKPTKGRIIFKDEDITDVPAHKRVAMGLGYSSGSIFPSMSVSENLELGGPKQHWPFKLFPVLKERLKQRAGTLSGGERMMLSLAKSIASNPDLLILDEPSAGLAPKVISSTFEVLAELRNEGRSILMSEQNTRKALTIADYVYVIRKGKVFFEGPADDIRNNEGRLKEAYLA